MRGTDPELIPLSKWTTGTVTRLPHHILKDLQ